MEMHHFRQKFQNHVPTLQDCSAEFAVLVPLVERPDGLFLLYEVRSAHLRHHAAEVCFPGGKREPNETFIECALRETEEELSIPRSEIHLLGTPDFLCSSGGFLLRPVLGLVSEAGMAALSPSAAEVSEVFTVPLSFFQTTEPEVYTYDLIPRVQEDFPYERVGISPDYPWSGGRVDVPVWYWQGHVIWGMTARLIRGLFSE